MIQGRMGPIIDKVVVVYELTLEDFGLDGVGGGDHRSRRARSISEAKDLCCWIAKELGVPLTNTEISAALNRERSTFTPGVQRCKELQKRDRWLRETAERLLSELRA